MLEDQALGRKTSSFVLQWHLTHACDMHCKHCYDRSNLRVIRLDGALSILDDVTAFCADRDVRPSITLSGGNPFFYPWFFDLYREIIERGIRICILGNPVPTEQLDRLVEIGAPAYFQISLEGLEEHNDCIRGDGAFRRALDFLPMLRERGIRAPVMITLTRDNMDQIIPVGELLRDRADRVTFNRLSQVGEGAALGLPDIEEYGRFMVDYMVARESNPTLGYKDNLFNIIRYELGMKLTGGCTGYGCGAAFNFLVLLPNGDVHACRKFPSPVGNILRSTFGEIYDSDEATRYRRGCTDCDGCPIRAKCGGCLAITSGHGLDPFKQRDPHCFM